MIEESALVNPCLGHVFHFYGLCQCSFSYLSFSNSPHHHNIRNSYRALVHQLGFKPRLAHEPYLSWNFTHVER